MDKTWIYYTPTDTLFAIVVRSRSANCNIVRSGKYCEIILSDFAKRFQMTPNGHMFFSMSVQVSIHILAIG